MKSKFSIEMKTRTTQLGFRLTPRWKIAPRHDIYYHEKNRWAPVPTDRRTVTKDQLVVRPSAAAFFTAGRARTRPPRCEAEAASCRRPSCPISRIAEQSTLVDHQLDCKQPGGMAAPSTMCIGLPGAMG